MKKYFYINEIVEYDEEEFMDQLDCALNNSLSNGFSSEEENTKLRKNVLNGQSEEIDGTIFSVADKPLEGTYHADDF